MLLPCRHLNVEAGGSILNNPGKQVYPLDTRNLAGSLIRDQSPFEMILGVIFIVH
jgi:hypothetical protein